MPSGECTRAQWDARYDEARREPRLPERFLRESVGRLKPGRVLDVACGEGRNCLYLASLPQFSPVEGIDWSERGLATAAQRARAGGLQLDLRALDLRQAELPEAQYDTIVVTRFLWRELCPRLAAALVPGGTLLYDTYMVMDGVVPVDGAVSVPGAGGAVAGGASGVATSGGGAVPGTGVAPGPGRSRRAKVQCPEHLLRPGELLQLFAGLEVLEYREEKRPERGLAAACLLARRPRG